MAKQYTLPAVILHKHQQQKTWELNSFTQAEMVVCSQLVLLVCRHNSICLMEAESKVQTQLEVIYTPVNQLKFKHK